MKRTLLAAIVAAGLLAGFGCSGGGQVAPSAPQPQQPQPRSAPATFTLKVPVAATTGATAKRPAYVSAGTQSITFAGPGIATQTLSLSPIATKCPPSGGFYACSLTFAAPVGNSTLTVQTFASTDGSGTPLSRNTIAISIVQDQTNNVPVTLNGVVSTLVLTLSPSSVTAGTAQAVTASLGGKDAAGDSIVGPGSFVDATGAALTPTLQSSDATDFAVGAQSGYSWPIAYNGANVAAPTITLSAGSLTNATQQIAVNPAPSPTSAPTAANVILNGDFEASNSTLASWFPCYDSTTAYAPINASPSPGNTTTTTAIATATAAPFANDSGVAQSVPVGATTAAPPAAYNGTTGAVHGGSNAARVGFIDYSLLANGNQVGKGKGTYGICQTVTVPTSSASLSLWLYEGSNTNVFATNNHLGAVFSGNPFTTAYAQAVGGQTSYHAAVAPAQILFAQDNCYNSDPGKSDVAACAIGTGAGGVWYNKVFDMSAYAGQSVTLFLGQAGSSTATTTFSYVYFDDVSLTGVTGTPAPLSVAPNPFNATQTGAATLTATESAYAGTLTVTSDNTSVITATSPATASAGTATINVNVVNAGFAHLTIIDSHNQQVVVPVTVTLTPVTIN